MTLSYDDVVHMMPWLLITVAMAIVLSLRLGAGFMSAAMALRVDAPPITKKLCWALTTINVASLFSFLGRFAAHLNDRQRFEASPPSGTFMVGQLLSLAIAAGGILVVIWLVTQVSRSMSQTERLARAMVTGPFVDIRTSDLGLTAREMEVLDVMLEGRFSDQQIAEALHITPSTAATHVRNVLRKADLHNRRDLILFYGASKVSGSRD
ncbi:MAG: Bacterial regulatory protein luxR family [Actinomycetota bacterium]|nr:Bacterial regulatory protein luxR family [Actinomycetota bacterium]